MPVTEGQQIFLKLSVFSCLKDARIQKHPEDQKMANFGMLIFTMSHVIDKRLKERLVYSWKKQDNKEIIKKQIAKKNQIDFFLEILKPLLQKLDV